MASEQNDLLQPPRAGEITRDEAIRSLLTNEDLSDLTIRGSDGTLVIANRCLLASRSPVFGRMLYGKFSEASKTEIDVGYDGFVIQAIVEYIYTDTAVAFENSNEDNETKWDNSVVRFLANLVNAADYFALPELRRKIEKAAATQMKKHQAVVPLFLAACVPNCDPTQVLQDTALEMVKKRPQILMDYSEPSLVLMHPSHMENILKEETLPMNEYSCFQLLQMWATVEEAPDDNNSGNPDASDWQKSRKRIAAQMTSHIDLARIDTTELSTTVTSSGLVTAEQLSDAYKTQALRLQKKCRTSYEQWRGGHVWNSSRTKVCENGSVYFHTETLKHPILKSGVHKWSIKVLRGSNQNVVVGVASSCWPIEPVISLRNQRGGWGLLQGTASLMLPLPGTPVGLQWGPTVRTRTRTERESRPTVPNGTRDSSEARIRSIRNEKRAKNKNTTKWVVHDGGDNTTYGTVKRIPDAEL